MLTMMQALRPTTPRLRSFTQAAAATDALLASQHEAAGLAVDDGESDDEGQGPNRGGAQDKEPESMETLDAADEDGDERSNEHLVDPTDDQDEDVVLIRDPKHDEVDEEAAADFDREFAKMMADTTDARRGDSRRAPPPVFDTAIPHVKKREEREAAEGRMHFTLLSKKGNRQQVSSVGIQLCVNMVDCQMRSLDIPMESSIAVNVQNYQQQSLAERQHLKRLVLENERRQGQSEVQGESLPSSAGSAGINAELTALVDISRRGGVKWRVAPG
jgi:regulator of nonsense transcripts 2